MLLPAARLRTPREIFSWQRKARTAVLLAVCGLQLACCFGFGLENTGEAGSRFVENADKLGGRRQEEPEEPGLQNFPGRKIGKASICSALRMASSRMPALTGGRSNSATKVLRTFAAAQTSFSPVTIAVWPVRAPFNSGKPRRFIARLMKVFLMTCILRPRVRGACAVPRNA